jgi:MazG family protein
MLQLLEIMQRLRDPENGCPWDVKQDFSTIAPYTIEEAYEVADAIARGDMADLKDELGDLLFQVVFHAHMASEQGSFDFDDVHQAICDKMLRRHPHVFADLVIRDAAHQKQAWEDYKADERKQKGEHSLMDGIPAGMAELQRAVKLQKRARKVGFDWPSAEPVLEKLDEELAEMRSAMVSGDRDAMEDELGDLLFATVNLARQLDMDPGTALRRANAKFEHRFRAMEEAVGGHDGLDAMSLDDMEALWQKVKKQQVNETGGMGSQRTGGKS